MTVKKKQSRRMGIILALLVTFLLLVWQVYSLVSSDLHTSTSADSQGQVVQHAAGIYDTPKVHNWRSQAQPTGVEREYLGLSIEIQKAKMRRQLLQQQVAIAEAEKKLATARKQASMLSSGGNAASQNWSEPASIGGYQLVYLAQVAGGQWEATLRQGDSLMRVHRDSRLNAGRRVVAVINKGLWIQDSHGVHWLSFPGEPAPHGVAALATSSPIHQKQRMVYNKNQTAPRKMITHRQHSSHPPLLHRETVIARDKIIHHQHPKSPVVHHPLVAHNKSIKVLALPHVHLLKQDVQHPLLVNKKFSKPVVRPKAHLHKQGMPALSVKQRKNNNKPEGSAQYSGNKPLASRTLPVTRKAIYSHLFPVSSTRPKKLFDQLKERFSGGSPKMAMLPKAAQKHVPKENKIKNPIVQNKKMHMALLAEKKKKTVAAVKHPIKTPAKRSLNQHKQSTAQLMLAESTVPDSWLVKSSMPFKKKLPTTHLSGKNKVNFLDGKESQCVTQPLASTPLCIAHVTEKRMSRVPSQEKKILRKYL